MTDDSPKEFAVAHRRWAERVAALHLARGRTRRLARMLARDPGGRLSARAFYVDEIIALGEVAARSMLALSERNRGHNSPD